MPRGTIEWEHKPGEGLTIHLKPPFGEMMPGETRGHVTAARKEMLMALRALIDSAIDRIDRKETASKESKTKIKVE